MFSIPLGLLAVLFSSFLFLLPEAKEKNLNLFFFYGWNVDILTYID